MASGPAFVWTGFLCTQTILIAAVRHRSSRPVKGTDRSMEPSMEAPDLADLVAYERAGDLFKPTRLVRSLAGRRHQLILGSGDRPVSIFHAASFRRAHYVAPVLRIDPTCCPFGICRQIPALSRPGRSLEKLEKVIDESEHDRDDHEAENG